MYRNWVLRKVQSGSSDREAWRGALLGIFRRGGRAGKEVDPGAGEGSRQGGGWLVGRMDLAVGGGVVGEWRERAAQPA